MILHIGACVAGFVCIFISPAFEYNSGVVGPRFVLLALIVDLAHPAGCGDLIALSICKLIYKLHIMRHTLECSTLTGHGPQNGATSKGISV